VTFLTFSTTGHFNRYAVDLAFFDFLVELLENAEVFIVCKLHFSGAVAVNTPTH
jgi:hypothetical protein